MQEPVHGRSGITMNARFHERLDEISAAAWDALGAHANPFTAHAFLAGLEQTGCIDRHAGWQAHHLGLYEGDTLVAAAPLYLKGNSHGEFVFDRSWAGAYARHGLDYYPKLLGAVPYSPVTGPRLLAGAGDGVQGRCAALVGAITQEVERLGLSSAHVNFVDDIDTAILDDLDWLPRFDWQFHWHNRGWPDFEAFLGALTAKKRKNIRHERAQVARAGITCEVRHGDELDDADWIVLPGSKQTSGDLAWLRAQGLVEPIVRHAARGRPVLGICGGMQMLGRTLADPEGVDGAACDALPGLGLLPLVTRYAAPKRLRRAALRFGAAAAPWHALARRGLAAYEIRCGRSEAVGASAAAVLFDAEGEAIGWQSGSVLGIAAHGLFEDAGVLRALFGRAARTLDDAFDALADLVECHLGAATLRALMRA